MTSKQDRARSEQRIGREHQLITDYQSAIYSYVQRMLRNSADSADVTQEIFATALARFASFDRRRELKPWIYRIATHTVYKHLRRMQLRRLKEKDAAMSRPWQDPGEDNAKREQERVVQEQLAALPRDARSLLILHYYNGLSQRELAEALDMPRSTIRDRLQHSRELLRRRLQASGHAACLPGVESFMQSAGSLEIPAEVSAKLFRLVGASALEASVPGLVMGGIVVSKKTIAVVFAFTIFAFATGMGVDRVVFRDPDESEETDARRRQWESLRETAAEFETLQSRHESLERELATAQARIRGLEGQLSQERRVQASAKESPPAPDATGIDWGRLAAMVAEVKGPVHRWAELRTRNVDSSELDPADQAAIRDLMLEWNRAAAHARTQTPFPVFDPDILPEFLSTLLGGLVGLNENQLATLGETSVQLLRDFPIDENTTPLQAYDARQSLFARVNAHIEEVLEPAQVESWNRIRPIWDPLAEGNRRHIKIGFDRPDTRDRLLEAWRHHYAFDDGQHELVSAVADEFLTESRALLYAYGQTENSQRDLDADERQELTDDFLRLQRRMDERLFANLTEEQRERLRRQFPVTVQLNFSQSFDRDTDRNRGF